MTIPAWTEVQLAVGGALRLACGDRRGLASFDASIDGFWRSFRAAFLCYPLYLLLLAFRITTAQWDASGVATILVVETIGFAISWVAFPLLMLPIARRLDRDNRYLGFMVAYNWSQIPQTVLFVVVALDSVTGLLSLSALHTAELIATLAVIVYEWYIARVALAISGAQATLVVVVDLVLGTAVGRVTQGLY